MWRIRAQGRAPSGMGQSHTGDIMANVDSINMLTLFVRIRRDARVQALAKELQHGFSPEIWDTLTEFRVLDARLTAIPDADDPNVFEALLLCTTFQMPNIEYQTVFFKRFPGTFVKLATAAVDSPFIEHPLTPEQIAAIAGGDEVAAHREALMPLFDLVRGWIDAHDLTLDLEPGIRPEPGQRNQFHLVTSGAKPGWEEAAQ
jgi:hypothetical protein